IDYQPDKMRLDVKIKELFQKKEQEIVGILEKFKNRVLKKDKAQTSTEEMELLELNKNTNQPNKMINQAQIAKDTLFQLECGTHDYGTKELQATINRDVSAHYSCKRKLEARELQGEIVRINGTTHLLERESSTDIEILENEEVSPIIADVTNEVEESLPTKVVYLIHNKARENISVLRWAPRNRVKFTSTNQTQITQEITTMTSQSSYQRIRNNKVACIKIQYKDQSRLEALKNSWALHYEAGKLSTLQNIPRTALESSLLKQLKYHKAKSVFIPNNRNGNSRSLVFIYFAESQDLNKATSQSVYYYNTRLHWKLEGSLLCTHKRKSIAREEYNPNKENLSKIEPSFKIDHSNTRERIYRKQQERSTLHQRKGRSLPKLDLIKYNRGSLFNKQGNTKTPCDMNNTGLLPERKLLEEILERLSNLERKQQTSENSSTSSFQKSRQLLKSCDNSAAPSMRKNSNNNIAPSTEILATRER
ncbi:1106_t:CDS:2, partial [Gigaspora margarita]